MTRVASFPHLHPRLRSVSGGYQRTVLSFSPLAFWPMDEASGSIAYDRSGNGYNGAYTGVDLGQAGQFGRTCPYFDGTNDFNNIAAVRSAFSGAAGSIQIWMKFAAGAQTDSTQRRAWMIQVDANNLCVFSKQTTNNLLSAGWRAGGATQLAFNVTLAVADWLHVAFTWDASANEYKLYFNGVQQGATQTTAGAWSGTPAATGTVIGAVNITPSTVWSGWLQYAAVWTRALTPAEILRLYTG